jgi:glycosyltransferase involved in cell wall biosynthesis
MAPWIVCQIGAREHYAIPRSLKRVGVSFKLVTDYWSTSAVMKLFERRLSQRQHPELVSSEVVRFNTQSLWHEAEMRMRGLQNWALFSDRNAWFGQKVAEQLPFIVNQFSTKPIVFSYSYAAATIFAKAKALGCKTILGQIDSGIEDERIMVELHQKHRFAPYPIAPARYWDEWRRECELADSIIVNSNWARNCLIRAGTDSAKTQITPLAYENRTEEKIKERHFPKCFSRDRPLRVLFLGRLSLRKGAVELAQAIRQLNKESVEWTFVGASDPSVIDLFSESPNVRLVSHVVRHDVNLYYANADVFILPTHCDGYAITQLEAASMGLPIIASRNCGEVVVHGKNGLLLDEVTSDAIVEAVKSILRNPSILESMSRFQSNTGTRTIDELGASLIDIQTKLL